MTQYIEFQNAKAEVFSFTEAGGVKEYHVMLHVTDYTLTFQQQLDAILDAYQSVITNTLPGAVTVFKRFFLSDSANQADDVAAADTSDCAKSIIQQAPLDGTKIGLWAYLMTDVASRLLPSELYEVSHGAYRHLWNGSAHNLAANSEYQTRLLFNEYVMQLLQEGCTLANNCIRTWLFVNDVDLNYGGVVRARNQVFFTQGLTNSSHFIASTGIGGRQQDPNVLTQMDNYAIAGIKPEQIRYLYAPTHLNRTSDYGVSFERGTRVDYGDRCHVIISGTASERGGAAQRGRMHLRRCGTYHCLSARWQRLCRCEQAVSGALLQQALHHCAGLCLSSGLAHRDGVYGGEEERQRRLRSPLTP